MAVAKGTATIEHGSACERARECGSILGEHAGIAQLGERQTEDLKVAGSIPAVGILFYFAVFCFAVGPSESVRSPALGRHGTLAEWLRRSIRNRLGIARGSSNLSGVV